MIRIKITSYKPSGKYFDEGIIEIHENMNVWDKEFYQILLDNSSYKGGFIVVDDIDFEKHNKFFQHLFRYEDLLAWVVD